MLFRPDLDPTRDEPLYRQLFRDISGRIESGELSAGERLPATRELAGLLGVNRATVSAAYELLEQDGWMTGQVGRGSFVAARRNDRPAVDWDRLLARGRRSDASGISAPINFAASRPPEELFPIVDFQRSCEAVLGSGRLGSILQLGSTSGYEPLRQRLMEEAREEGAFGPDDDLLITNGCQQAVDLLRRVLVRPGDRVAVEDPVYAGLKNTMADAGATLVPLPIGMRGMEPPADLGAGMAIFTPNFQNPTGLSLTLETREWAIDSARRAGAVLVENDIYSGLRYEGDSLPSLKRLAPKAGSVLLRSFSKIAFPGLRLGWVIGPRRLIAALREAKQLADLHSGQFAQAVMLEFIESGRLAAHASSMVAAGRERLRATLKALGESLPEGSRWTRPEGGFNIWITLPDEIDAAALSARARRAGVAYLPGSVFAVSRSFPHSLRLSFGGSPVAQIGEGIRVLGAIFNEERSLRVREEREPAPALV